MSKMKYQIRPSSKFKRDLKKCKKSGLDLDELQSVIDTLANDISLPDKYHDHALKGTYSDCRECHINPDWLLIYKIDNGELILTLVETGSHSYLFKM